MLYNIISLITLFVYTVLIFKCNESNIATYIIGIILFLIMRVIGYLEGINKNQLNDIYNIAEFQSILMSNKYKIEPINKYAYKVNNTIYRYNKFDCYWHKSI